MGSPCPSIRIESGQTPPLDLRYGWPMKKSDSAAGSKGRLTVICSAGKKQRFLRGMITHDLVLRGIDFDDAYTIAHAVRDRLAGRQEVDTAEIRDLITAQLEGLYGENIPHGIARPALVVPQRYVVSPGERQRFSRGLLARSIQGAGLELDRAYRLVAELEETLQAEGVGELAKDDLTRRVADLLEEFESKKAAQRYRLVRRLKHLPRPLVIYIGGASGTGKSTLALELAPLLKIYRINATDTIRQMMRMVFSPQILPALHSSSFEVLPGPGEPLDDRGRAPIDDERLLATFEEQSLRVCVGVRAVVERAVAENMSILVEGVHLYPPLVPFADLEGLAYQIPLVLGTNDPEVHRSRFLGRARTSGRRAERYLEGYGHIRAVHEHILQQAENHDVPLLDTSSGEPAEGRALRLVVGMLRKRAPYLARSEADMGTTPPTLLIIIDGLADRPIRALGGRTPLEAAETPTLDRLASEGQCGLADTITPGVVPDTAAGSLALFGQSPLALRRGPVEAVGAGLELQPGDIALRANFATLDDEQRVVDRRAGRIREGTHELARMIDRLRLPGEVGEDLVIRVAAGTEHRLALVLRGDGLSSEIQGSDPGDGAAPGPPLIPRPNDPNDHRAVETARLLALFEQEARKVLADHPVNRKRRKRGLPVANTVLTRGAGRIHRLLPLEEAGIPLRVTCISGDRTVLGLASWLGAETLCGEGMTANLDTDLKAKMDAAATALERRDLVVLHLKGADIAAHDRRPDLKVDYLERVDAALGKLLQKRKKPLRIAVASDHATLSESGQHSADPLPVLVWGEGIEADSVSRYDESSVATGTLQRFPLQLLLGRLFDLS